MAAEPTLGGARTPLRSRLAARPGLAVALFFSGILLASFVIRTWASRRIEAPWIMGDELVYSELAKSFAATGHFRFRGGPTAWYSIYPAVISPAWWAGSLTTTYDLVKTFNALLMTLAAVPVFLWTRRFTGDIYALLAATLVLLIPDFVYADEIMTESLALPAFLLAAYVIAVALEKPTALRQLAALAAVGLAVSVRLQALIFVAILPTAAVFKVLLDLRAAEPVRGRARFVARELARFWPAAAVAAGAALAYVGLQAARGHRLSGITGGYTGVTNTSQYHARSVLRWSIFHLGDLSLATGVLPVSAFIIVLVLAWRRGSGATAAERAFLAVTAAALPWMTVQVAAFASYYSLRIEERNLFYVIPLLVMAFVLWLARGAPRPATLAMVAVVIPLALLATLPLESLLNVSLTTDTFSLDPLYRLFMNMSGAALDVRWILGLGAIVAGVLFAVVPRRLATPVLAGALAVYFVGVTLAVIAMSRGQSIATRNASGAADPSWVDDTVGKKADVAYINSFGLAGNPHMLWQTEFWNRSVGPILNLGESNPMAGDGATLDRTTGRFSVADPSVRQSVDKARYAVVDNSLTLAGQLAAQTGFLRLYKIRRPLSLASSDEGIYADGWMETDAARNVYVTPSGKRGHVRITLSRRPLTGAPPSPVTIYLGPLVERNGTLDTGSPTLTRTVTVGPKRNVTLTLPAPKPPYRLRLHVASPFSALQLGQGDTRNLGALLTITPES